MVFHYNSTRGAVLGISRVIDIGPHKGGASTHEKIPGTQCIRYSGRHLSFDDLTVEQKESNKKYTHYLEVHTVQLRPVHLGKLRDPTPQVYLLRIDDAEARRFIKDNGICLDDPTT